MTAETIHLFLVEDHTSSREALAELLDRQPDFEVTGQAGTIAEASALLASGIDVDLALVDLALPDGHGTELIRELRRIRPNAVSLVLTGSVSTLERARAVEAGAFGLLLKTASTREISEAIRRTSAGQLLFPPQEAAELFRWLGEYREQWRIAEAVFSRITPRERDIVALLAEGLSDKEIAVRLGLREKTVRNYMTTLLHKLDIDSRNQLLILAIQHGVVTII